MTSYELEMQHICFEVKDHVLPWFLKLTERGFKLKVGTGRSIRELFCKQFQLSDDYVDNRIQTIFLDGMPVDNVDTAWVKNGSRLALSAAMPGLVGATFRKGGHYASLRDTISYSKSKKPVTEDEGEITLKFFNVIAKELGPSFLQRGVIIEGRSFQDFLLSSPSFNSKDFEAAIISIHLNDKNTDVAGLLEMNWENKEVFLQVTSKP